MLVLVRAFPEVMGCHGYIHFGLRNLLGGGRDVLCRCGSVLCLLHVMMMCGMRESALLRADEQRGSGNKR